MTNKPSGCAAKSWGLALLAGLLVVVMAVVAGHRPMPEALFFGGVVFVLLGAFLSWLSCGPRPVPAAAKHVAIAPETPETVNQIPVPSAPKEHAQDMKPAEKSEPSVIEDQTPQAPVLNPSKPLSGEAELASRRGDRADTPSAAEQAPKAGPEPVMLEAPREGGADDLKQIKGIGPKLEQACFEFGIYHFDQIASWSPEQAAWVNDTLPGVRGRVLRDDWVGQARVLAKW